MQPPPQDTRRQSVACGSCSGASAAARRVLCSKWPILELRCMHVHTHMDECRRHVGGRIHYMQVIEQYPLGKVLTCLGIIGFSAHAHVRAHARAHTLTYSHTHSRTHPSIHTCTHPAIHARAGTSARIYLCVHGHVHPCICACTPARSYHLRE